MSWTQAPADIYERIRAALFRNKSEYFHPEYPDEWLEDRLRRFLPRLAFYCTGSCILRPVVKRDFICFEQILSFGSPSPRQALSLIALTYDLAEHLALPILAESFNPVRHRHVGNVSEQELQFPLFNANANDPWDADLTADLSDPHNATQRLLGELPEDIEPYLSPLYGSVYFDEERSDAVEIIDTFSRFARALHVSSSSKSLTNHLHRTFAARQNDVIVGEPRINYITTIPNLAVLERFRQRDRTRPVEKHILLEGRLHAL